MKEQNCLIKGQKFAVGVDIGGTNIKSALLDINGKIYHKIEFPTEAHRGWEDVLNRIYHGIHQLINLEACKVSDILGIGLGIPGLPNFTTGEVLWGPNIGWEKVPAGSWLSGKLGLPVYIDNDGNVAAYGEFWAGAGKNAKILAAVTIGTGVGAGIIINGNVLRGVGGAAGEFGHMIILPDGPTCSCGRKGCLETLTSATAIVKAAERAIDEGHETSLAKLRQINAKAIFQGAAAGDKVSQEIIDELAYYLGIGLANITNLLNPDLILIGGGVSRGGSLLMNPLRKYTLENSLPTAGQQVKIELAQLGNDAGAVGAAGIVFAEGSSEIK